MFRSRFNFLTALEIEGTVFGISSTLKIEAEGSSETLVPDYATSHPSSVGTDICNHVIIHSFVIGRSCVRDWIQKSAKLSDFHLTLWSPYTQGKRVFVYVASLNEQMEQYPLLISV